MKILHLTLSMFLYDLVKLKITIAADLIGILYVLPQNSSCKIQGRLNSLGLNLMTVNLGIKKYVLVVLLTFLDCPR